MAAVTATPTALLVTRQVMGECAPRRRDDGVLYCDTHALRGSGPPSPTSSTDEWVNWELPGRPWACGDVARRAEFLGEALRLASTVQVASIRAESGARL